MVVSLYFLLHKFDTLFQITGHIQIRYKLAYPMRNQAIPRHASFMHQHPLSYYQPKESYVSTHQKPRGPMLHPTDNHHSHVLHSARPSHKYQPHLAQTPPPMSFNHSKPPSQVFPTNLENCFYNPKIVPTNLQQTFKFSQLKNELGYIKMQVNQLLQTDGNTNNENISNNTDPRLQQESIVKTVSSSAKDTPDSSVASSKLRGSPSSYAPLNESYMLKSPQTNDFSVKNRDGFSSETVSAIKKKNSISQKSNSGEFLESRSELYYKDELQSITLKSKYEADLMIARNNLMEARVETENVKTEAAKKHEDLKKFYQKEISSLEKYITMINQSTGREKAEMEKQIQTLRSRVHEVEALNKVLEQDRAESMLRKDKEIEEVRNRIFKQYEELKASHHEREIKDLKAKLDAESEKRTSLESQIDQVSQQICRILKICQAEDGSAQSLLRISEEKHASSKFMYQIETLKKQISILVDNKNRLIKEVTENAAMNKTLKKQLEEKNSNLETLKTLYTDAESNLTSAEALQQKIFEYNSEITLLRDELQEAAEAHLLVIEAKDRKIYDLQDELRKLRLELKQSAAIDTVLETKLMQEKTELIARMKRELLGASEMQVRLKATEQLLHEANEQIVKYELGMLDSRLSLRQRIAGGEHDDNEDTQLDHTTN